MGVVLKTPQAENDQNSPGRIGLMFEQEETDIITADFIHARRTTFPTKMKTGIDPEELK